MLTPLNVHLPWGCPCDLRAAQRCHHGPAMPPRDLLLALTPSCPPSDKQGPGGASPSGVCPPWGTPGGEVFPPCGRKRSFCCLEPRGHLDEEPARDRSELRGGGTKRGHRGSLLACWIQPRLKVCPGSSTSPLCELMTDSLSLSLFGFLSLASCISY